ncbi:MAG: phosphoribosylglycinamide formyltransferase [Bacteroidetes bacterium]|nr:MAG: phosphoribosylglycinamide formyltransferase [Bacteroidota bacterium]REK04675.1 MAG: phosphoribosylglycinamide formyltransferase [Bacteroidota bacterium]REK36150.1 MAG: phosphoribosylglycinamide formyltransferase [Bacteroidota bacterium]REK51479.1 MAG: phosphoribosylglycinamide formyltransferase [Bacteroidota bacterium]
MIRLSVFASGSGTNAENIIRHFNSSKYFKVVSVYCNKPDAAVIGRAKKLHVPCRIFNRDDFYYEGNVLKWLKEDQTDFIVLAGFLLLVPNELITAFPDRIINIHPALLPKFGGKGFYGSRVHQAVTEAGEVMSGITVHLVNEKFDEGRIIFQAGCHVSRSDTAESLAKKIHELEYRYFPRVIEKFILSNITK